MWFYVIFISFKYNAIESNHEFRFAPKTMKTAATDHSIDMGSEGCNLVRDLDPVIESGQTS
jgi:hypothetical protein